MPIASIIKKLFGGSREAARAAPKNSPTRQWISNPWHAVSVIPCKPACGVARQSSRVRFLSNEAPKLPLPGCDRRTCECRYRHHDDRRRSLRRSSDVMSANRAWAGREQRVSKGRRATDQS
jgi:hypothetical protein